VIDNPVQSSPRLHTTPLLFGVVPAVTIRRSILALNHRLRHRSAAAAAAAIAAVVVEIQQP